MKTLIIPDVHERYSRLLGLEPEMEEADRVVLLGDFWDTFYPQGQQGLIATWLLGKLYDPKYTVLWGNHDAHYAFNHRAFLCSGYDAVTKWMLDKEMSEDAWRKFKFFTRVGPFVVSHAGFNSKTRKFMDQTEEALEAAFAGKFHPLWAAGYASGGTAEFGGPTWLRWWEIERLEFPQIVGHTIVKEPKEKDGNWNLDTDSKHVAWVEEETGEVVVEQCSEL